MSSFRVGIGHHPSIRTKRALPGIAGKEITFVIQPASTGTTDVSFPLYGFQHDVTARSTWRTTADRCTGWDWSSPSNAAPANLSGMFQFQGNTGTAGHTTAWPANFPGNKIYKINADWCDLEPTRTISRDLPNTSYNLDIFNLLQTLDPEWDGVQIDVRGNVFSVGGSTSTSTDNVTAPLWLANGGANIAYTGTTHTGGGGQSGTTILYYDIGDSDWYIPFRHLIRAIAAYVVPGSGVTVPNHPRFKCQILHGQSNSIGEEDGLGANPATGHLRTLEIWAEEFGSSAHKQAFTGEGKPQGDHDIVYAGGAGSRGGIIENLLRNEYTPHLVDGTSNTGFTKMGQIVEPYRNSAGVVQTAQYYLDVDESFPPILNNCHFGDQNEFPKLANFTNPDPWDVGTDPARVICRYTFVNLRAIQMRRNILAIENKASFRTGTFNGGAGSTLQGTQATSINGFDGMCNPENTKWTSLQLGKRVDGIGGTSHRAREAWIALFRTWARAPVLGPLINYRLHNFEFYLKQRETNGATSCTLDQAWGGNVQGGNLQTDDPNFPATLWRLDRARTMDSASVGIGLTLDKRFLTGASTSPGVAVKITYLDNNTQTWTVESRANNFQTASVSTTNQNTGLVKTRTVFFPSFFVNASADVDIWLKGSLLTPFMFVRVIKLGTL